MYPSRYPPQTILAVFDISKVVTWGLRLPPRLTSSGEVRGALSYSVRGTGLDSHPIPFKYSIKWQSSAKALELIQQDANY